MRSMLINAISDARFFNMLMRASTSRWRSLAAAYSAFSRRSPSSRARLISFGNSSFSSRSSAPISSSNFLIRRSFIVSGIDPLIVPQCYPSQERGAMPTTITSRRNPLVARFRDVASGDHRDRLLLDGVHLIRGALEAGLALEEVVVSTQATARDEVRALVESLPRGVSVSTVSSSVMDAVSPVRTPSGIVALSAAPPAPEERVFARPAPIVVAADIQDPGNLGAIVRVADAGGAAGVIVAGHSANPFGWKALRGSMASALRLPIAIIPDAGIALDAVRRRACRV